jgi:hypothetical protein
MDLTFGLRVNRTTPPNDRPLCGMIAVGRSKNLHGRKMAKQRRTANGGDHVAQAIAARAHVLDLDPNFVS